MKPDWFFTSEKVQKKFFDLWWQMLMMYPGLLVARKRCSYNIIFDAALLLPSGLVSLWSSRMRVVPLYPALHRPAPLYWYSRVGAAITVTSDTSELVTFALRAISAYLCLAPCSTLHNSLRNKVSSVQQLLLLIGSLQPRHALRQSVPSHFQMADNRNYFQRKWNKW